MVRNVDRIIGRDVKRFSKVITERENDLWATSTVQWGRASCPSISDRLEACPTKLNWAPTCITYADNTSETIAKEPIVLSRKKILQHTLIRTTGAALQLSPPDAFRLSPGEIHFLWWFIQGSIMNPSTRQRMRKAWGFCERHAWGWMIVEASFRSGYMHGPALLYEDLMRAALNAFQLNGPAQHGRLRRRLRDKGPCLMCEEGYGPHSKGIVKEKIVRQGRDLGELLRLAKRTEPYWRDTICGRCAGTASTLRCRQHLIEDESSRLAGEMSVHRSSVTYIFDHLVKYARSFQFEFQGSQTEEDTAALISAVGWCSGWRLLLSIMGETNTA